MTDTPTDFAAIAAGREHIQDLDFEEFWAQQAETAATLKNMSVSDQALNAAANLAMRMVRAMSHAICEHEYTMHDVLQLRGDDYKMATCSVVMIGAMSAATSYFANMFADGGAERKNLAQGVELAVKLVLPHLQAAGKTAEYPSYPPGFGVHLPASWDLPGCRPAGAPERDVAQDIRDHNAWLARERGADENESKTPAADPNP